MGYAVQLFYGDVGFTSDYSNILDFNSLISRELYFTGINHITFRNVDYNKIQLNESTIKIAFDDKDKLKYLENFNYLRVETDLNTKFIEDEATKYQTVKYYFIVGYSIIASSENLTTVEFSIQYDYWMNHQFDFTFRECNVERMHVDRWDVSGNMIYTKPSNDMLESFMKVNKSEGFADFIRIAVDVSTSPQPYESPEIALCVVSYTTANKGQWSASTKINFLVFPFRIDGEDIGYTVTKTGSQFDVTANYPNLGDILDGNLAGLFGMAPSAICNVSILFHSGIKIVSTITDIAYQNFIAGYDFDSGHYETNNKKTALKLNGLSQMPWNEQENHIVASISRPQRPVNNAGYDKKYEPMLYKSPVMKRYITNGDASEIMEIPDVKLSEFFATRRIYIKNVVSPTSIYNIIALESMSDVRDIPAFSMISAIGQFSSYTCDVINDYWQEYCQTQREADRTMMWANILTGGIAEGGSTAVSAGIGYRSNMERAYVQENFTRAMYLDYKSAGGALREADFYRTQASGSGRQVPMRVNAAMYRGMAGQAMAMSGLGGATAFGANAIGNVARQVSKESGIKNKPAQLTKAGNWFGIVKNNMQRLHYIELIADNTSYERYADIFKKFGYSIGSVVKPDIKSRKYFNYIKTNGAVLTGALNQLVLTKLATIFDNGTTVWHMDYTTKETLYTYDKENIERSLM